MKAKTMPVYECICGRIYKTERKANACHSQSPYDKSYWLGCAESLDELFDQYCDDVDMQDY